MEKERGTVDQLVTDGLRVICAVAGLPIGSSVDMAFICANAMPTAAPVGHAQPATIVDLSLGAGHREILRKSAIPTHEIVIVL